MTVFGAMLLDAYRELNSKKLFWVILVLSGMVVLSYGSMGFTETGVSMFYGLWDIESSLLTKESPLAALLYRSIFSSFIVGIWLAWIATILALISTTTIFPDFIAGGSVDLVLSKPIRRSTIFIMKFLCSLLFVLLQVSIFCVGVFLCIRWRLGEWNWMIFAAIPVVMSFYSYLFAVNVLVGVITRSALTALLITMLFWVSLFSLNMGEGIITQFHTQAAVITDVQIEAVTQLEKRFDALDPEERAGPVGQRIAEDIEEQQDSIRSTTKSITTLGKWQKPIRWTQWLLPKTSETIGLLERWLTEEGAVTLFDLMSGNITTDADGNYVPLRQDQDREVMLRLQEEYTTRSLWYVMGTSFVFELVVLGLACLVFVRRDY